MNWRSLTVEKSGEIVRLKRTVMLIQQVLRFATYIVAESVRSCTQ